MEDTTSTTTATDDSTHVAATDIATQQAVSVPPSFSFHNVIGADGKFKEGWQNELPKEYDELKPTLANFRDFHSFSKSHRDNMTAARSKLDGMVKVPGADATAEEKAAFAKALGVPDDAKGYDFSKIALPDGVTAEQIGLDKFAEIAHKTGAPPGVAAEFAAAFVNHLGEQREQFRKEGQEFLAKSETTLRNAFGSNYEKRMQDAQRAASSLGVNPDLLKVLEPEVTLAFARVTEMVSEDKLISPNQFQNKLSPQSQADAIRNDVNGPYWNPAHPQHKEYVARLNELMAQATGEKAR